MKNLVAAALCALAVLSAPIARAQDADATDMQALKAAVANDKRALVSSTLELTPAEAKRFWPLYDAYQRRVTNANKRRTGVLQEVIALDKPASNLFAKKLADELMAADEDEIRARRTLYTSLAKALPAKKTARYMQLEGKIRSLQAYEAASAIPLVK